MTTGGPCRPARVCFWNTIVDHLKHTLNDEPAGVVPAPFILVTLHRRELVPYIDFVVSGLLAALEAGNTRLRAGTVQVGEPQP